MSISREEALSLLKEHVKNERMLNHSYASEAVLRALARRLNEDEEKWGLAGLLHDIDVEATNADMHTHGLEAVNILKNKNIDDEIIEAIKMHNEDATGIKRSTKFQHALAAGETITGLIVATTLVYPDKKIQSIKTKSVTKRMKEKAFAASVNRETIMECEQIGIPINEFAEISINAMREISDILGL
ncbi:MAG: HDIG domain-containing protein [Bacteroidales bacterium]|nr:HDIG domain-containing protein [Bacteroidales bacterium]